MEDKKFKRTIIYIVLAVGIVFGFLALLNGRYINADGYAFDQWSGKYVSKRSANTKDASFTYKLFHWEWD